MNKKVSLIYYLLNNNIDFYPDMVDGFGKTPLIHAVIAGDKATKDLYSVNIVCNI